MRERPSSAIYPSESFYQSLRSSRRGRSSLSLSKSVSTNNISGWEVLTVFNLVNINLLMDVGNVLINNMII